jgi:phospho-N-acetylmuramoyl-pentapeptide-transferase
MLYHLFDWFKQQNIHFPGSGLFEFITFRVVVSDVVVAGICQQYSGRRLINYLRRKQIGESVRDLGLAGESEQERNPLLWAGSLLFFPSLYPLYCWQSSQSYVRLMIV